MEKIRNFFVLSLTLVLISVIFTGCERQGEKLEITFAGTEGATAGQSRMMMEVAQILNDSGRFTVNVFVAGSLSGDTDNLVTQARLGVNLVIPSDPTRLASQFNIPDLNILMAPYAISEVAALDRLYETALFREWQTALEAQGVIIVANMFNGLRHFVTTTPVRNVSDLSGLRIRGFGNDMGQALARYLGFAQISMNTNEIYPGIQTRALDGTEITLSAADSFRLHEVAGYIALTSHYMLQSTFVTGRTMLNRMSDEDREFFLKTVQDVSRKYSRIIAEEELELIETFRRNGVEVNAVDIAEFERAIAPLYVNNDLNFTPGLRDRLLRELGL